MESRYGQTSFRDYSHPQLIAMLREGRVPDVVATGGRWRDIADALDGMALSIDQQHRPVAALWDGPAAAAHEAMMATLVDGLRRVAFAARRLSDQLAAAGEALKRAQQRMASLPPPVELQPLDESVLAAASTRVRDERWAQSAARQAQATRAIQDYRRAQAAAATVTAAAVQIMEELRDNYRDIDLPRPPTIENPPTVGPDGGVVFGARAASAGVASTTPPPLLADLWRNGLIATAGIPPAQVLAGAGSAAVTSSPPGLVVSPTPEFGGAGAPRSPAQGLGVPDVGGPPDLSGFAAGGIGPLPSFDPGAAGGGLALDEPVPAIGTAAVGPSAASGVMPPGQGAAVGGLPFFPPMLGGMGPMSPGGDLRRSDSPWLTNKLPIFDIDPDNGIENVDAEIVP